MVESLDSFHGTSDELVDPYCDPCNAKGLNVRVCGFCKDCVQFLCTDCYGVHGNPQACRHHDFVQGEDMPKSQADKPPRFQHCDVHSRLLKDQFCCEHKILLCFLCSSSSHKGCSTTTVEDACKNVHNLETDALYKNVKCLQDNLKSALPPVDNEIKNIKDQEKAMLNDAQKIYDQMIAKAEHMFGSIKNEIQTSCQSQISDLSRHQKKVKDTIINLDSPLSDLREQKDNTVDAKLFLRIQEIVSYITKFTTEAKESSKALNFGSLTFVPSQPLKKFLSSSFTIGAICRSESKTDTEIVVPEITFPVSPLKQTTSRSQTGQAPGYQNLGGAVPKAAQAQCIQEVGVSAAKSLSARSIQPLLQINAVKQGTYNIKRRGDTKTCYIQGIAIFNGKILMTDYYNSKVKMFSHDMKFLSSVTVPGRPWNIAVISEGEAVVTTDNKSLVMLGISGSQLSIKTETQFSYDVHGINRYKDKLAVTSPDSDPPSVSLIDETGSVYWSVSSDQQGQPSFLEPLYVSSPGDGRSSTLIVTDMHNHTLTLLNGDTGEVITRRQLEERKDPKGITTDSAGNVYVCYWGTSEVAVLSGDLSEEKILLSVQDGLSGLPQAIVYDEEAHQLIISYWTISGCDDVDHFQLS